MRLSFHQRILLILICLGAVPTALAMLGWGLTLRSTTQAPGPRDAIEGVAQSGRVLLRSIDSTRLQPDERHALADHASKLNTAIGQFQRADTFNRYYYAGLGILILLLGGAFLYASVRFGGHLSRQLSRPIEELIGWTGNIRRMEPLPPDRPGGALPNLLPSEQPFAKWPAVSSGPERRRSRRSGCEHFGRPPDGSHTRCVTRSLRSAWP